MAETGGRLAEIIGFAGRTFIALRCVRVGGRVIIAMIIMMIRIDHADMLVSRAVEMGHGSTHRPVRERQDENEQG